MFLLSTDKKFIDFICVYSHVYSEQTLLYT